MLQNVSNCYKSQRSRNKNDLPYFIVVLVIIWGLPGLVWSFWGEKLGFFIFRVCWTLKAGNSFALHLTWSSINSITINESHTSVLLVGSRSYFNLSKIPLKYDTRLSWYAFSFEVHTWIFASRVSVTKLPSAGDRRGWVRLSTSKRRHFGVQRGRFNRK